MKPYRLVAEARSPDGTVAFSLHEHDGRFFLKNDGRDLMSTALTFSEELLAEVGCAGISGKGGDRQPRLLIGGLGLGFTLKRALALTGPGAAVTVVELIPEIVEWNRTHLAAHTGRALEDPRTRIHVGDFHDFLGATSGGSFDAILVDIDESPDSLVLPVNRRLYTPAFLARIRKTLVPGGTAAFWFAEPMPRFVTWLEKAGFRDVRMIPAKAHAGEKRRARHAIYAARRPK